ncbi:DNA repair protein rad5 [Colletotrichum chrysophilum]|uniref:DNA repair protein rad5 n=1 Tax=Colletotrichum chrysophilum TaxID=1836956 RepID=A0AAD9AYT2_9PEZI|nr:DNA repair protein rad5 [Colletotrichum chrysophilum]
MKSSFILKITQIAGIEALLQKADQTVVPDGNIPVKLESSSTFKLLDETSLEGLIQHQARPITEVVPALLDSPQIRLETHCCVKGWSINDNRKRKASQVEHYLCELSMVVYGPMNLFECAGDFFEQYEVHLQTPTNCLRSVKYCNPHMLSWTSLESSPLTSDLGRQTTPPSHRLEIVDSYTDILEVLNINEDLDKAAQPESILTPLVTHQKQALTFMTLRESPSFLFDKSLGLWDIRYVGGKNTFVSKVSQAEVEEKPPISKGGVIADPMEFGKTLTKSCLKTVHDLETTDLILTTYDTVTSEWRQSMSQASQQSILLSTFWDRLIVDEAHIIRNPTSQRTRAVCSLNANSRWAMSGTPIQNGLQDLATVLKFLRVYPYSDPAVFRTDITSLWKSGNGEEAIQRLKLLIRSLFLRRPKSTLQLPARHDLRFELDFRPEERAYYDTCREKAREEIETPLGSGDPTSNARVNALTRIEMLRGICNLGVLYEETSSKTESEWAVMSQEVFDFQRELGAVICIHCDTQTLESEGAFGDIQSSSYLSKCLRFVCSDCSEKIAAQRGCVTCGCEEDHSCPVEPVYVDIKTKHLATTRFSPTKFNGRFPTKIQALVLDIEKLGPDSKWWAQITSLRLCN